MQSGYATRNIPARPPTCLTCGRSLSVGYYCFCRLCSATYCYTHAPDRCDHMQLKAERLDITA